MKRACILTIGSEIVEGIIMDKNSVYLSKRLLELGYKVVRIASVDDVLEDIIDEVKRSLKKCDLLITTGGLGPTKDDLTREAISRAFGIELVFDEDLYRRVSGKVRKFAGRVVKSVKKEAMVLKGAEVVENNVGSAPGQLLKVDGKTILILPGPPSEMKDVFEEVSKKLKAGKGYLMKILKFYGVRESTLEDELSEIIYSYKNVKVATQASYTMGVWLRFTAPFDFKDELDDLVGKVRSRKRMDIYAEDDETMEDRLVSLLKKSGKTLSVAESCSGGLLSSLLVNVSGVSEVFKGGIIAYNNFVKEKVLGVSRDVLERFGSVSKECAREMSAGVKRIFGSDYAIAVSGVAGPESLEGKPVGLVYIDVYTRNHTTFEKKYSGTRGVIRVKAAMDAMDSMRRILGG